ncbi:MAG: MlaD family protein [Bacteroidales bacterium]|jgi:phospholipid/cholesterol/gamma-HCH transport system substrate-binding protein
MKISKEAKTGLIAIVVLAISIWGYNFLKGKNILKPRDVYYVVFDRADGLIESGNVMLQGYKIGNITSLYFDHENSGKFIVKIILEDKIKIPLNSVVQIKQVNPLASTSDLEIIFSDNDLYHVPGDTLASAVGGGMLDVITGLVPGIESVLYGIDSVLISLNKVLTPESENDLRNSISSLNSSLTALDKSLSENGSLSNSFKHLEEVTENLSSKNEQISETLDHLAGISSSVDSADPGAVIKKLDSSLVSFRSIISKINGGEGSMGKIINDSSLYTNLDSTSYHLNLLLKDLQEHPKRYVHFSVFGKSDK